MTYQELQNNQRYIINKILIKNSAAKEIGLITYVRTDVKGLQDELDNVIQNAIRQSFPYLEVQSPLECYKGITDIPERLSGEKRSYRILCIFSDPEEAEKGIKDKGVYTVKPMYIYVCGIIDNLTSYIIQNTLDDQRTMAERILNEIIPYDTFFGY